MFRIYRPYVFPDEIDPAIGKDLKRLGVKFEPILHADTDAIICLLATKVDAASLSERFTAGLSCGQGTEHRPPAVDLAWTIPFGATDLSPVVDMVYPVGNAAS